MRAIAAAFVIAVCVAGAALAQEEQAATVPFQPQWEQRPSAHDFARYIPDEAILSNVSGVVHLCCTPRDDRNLDCRVAFETPRQRGFGVATLRAAHNFRLTQESLTAFRANPGAWLQIPVVYQTSSPTPASEENLRHISEGTRGLCAPAGADPGPTVEPIVVSIR